MTPELTNKYLLTDLMKVAPLYIYISCLNEYARALNNPQKQYALYCFLFTLPRLIAGLCV